jgi:hypothetical protein
MGPLIQAGSTSSGPPAPDRPVPRQRPGDLAHAAGQLERGDEVGVRSQVAERLQVGVAQRLDVGLVDQPLRHPEGDKHAGERVGDHAVAPVVEPRVAAAGEDVPGVKVVVVEAERGGRRGQRLAPACEGLAHRGHACDGLAVGRLAVPPGVGAHRVERLVEARGHHRRPHVGHTRGQYLADVWRELALQNTVHRQDPLEGIHERGALQLRAERRAAVGQQDPRPVGVDGERDEHAVGHHAQQQLVEGRLEGGVSPGGLQPHRPASGRDAEDRRPRAQVRLLGLAGPLAPGLRQPRVHPLRRAPPPGLGRPERDAHALVASRCCRSSWAASSISLCRHSAAR